MYITVDVDVDDIIGEIDSSDMVYELTKRSEYNNTDLFDTSEKRIQDILDNINILDMLEFIEDAVDKFEISVYQKTEINKISERLFQKTKG